VDASVFPFPLASHYRATVYAVAEEVSPLVCFERRERTDYDAAG